MQGSTSQPGTRTAVNVDVDPQSLKGVAETVAIRRAQAAMVTYNVHYVDNDAEIIVVCLPTG